MKKITVTVIQQLMESRKQLFGIKIFHDTDVFKSVFRSGKGMEVFALILGHDDGRHTHVGKFVDGSSCGGDGEIRFFHYGGNNARLMKIFCVLAGYVLKVVQ